MLGQDAYVALRFLPCTATEARSKFGDLPWLGDELVVVSDRGDVWVGPAAFLTCLWALAAGLLLVHASLASAESGLDYEAGRPPDAIADVVNPRRDASPDQAAETAADAVPNADGGTDVSTDGPSPDGSTSADGPSSDRAADSAPPVADASAADVRRDPPPKSSGGGCSAGGAGSPTGGALAMALLVLSLWVRPRRYR